MHYAVMNTWPVKGRYIDHKDRDGLNNQRENLRWCTGSQNQANRCIINLSSGYKGVYWDNPTNSWRAKIGFKNRTIHIGRFKTAVEAANAYDTKAVELFGEYALTNCMLKEAGLVA